LLINGLFAITAAAVAVATTTTTITATTTTTTIIMCYDHNFQDNTQQILTHPSNSTKKVAVNTNINNDL
jgi:hypothetical protein